MLYIIYRSSLTLILIIRTITVTSLKEQVGLGKISNIS
jgi:hypothetical protein